MSIRLVSPSKPEELGVDPGNELMARFARGDAAAFEALYKDHKKGVYNFCARMLSGRADPGEAMQEVFFKVISAARSWQPRAKFKTWLYTIARNHCHDLLRKVRAPTVEVDESIAASPSPSGDPSLRALIASAVDALPEEQREVFVMAAYLEMSFPEIAEVVGAPLNTTKSRMRLAVKHLRAHLAKAGVVAEESE